MRPRSPSAAAWLYWIGRNVAGDELRRWRSTSILALNGDSDQRFDEGRAPEARLSEQEPGGARACPFDCQPMVLHPCDGYGVK